MTSDSIVTNLSVSEIDNLPDKPPRSKLEPHRELIRELRRKGRTYREVTRLFHERLGLYVAPSTLHSFVKVRAKHRKRSQFELPPLVSSAPSLALDHVAALRAKPVVPKSKPARFVFRENEPLTLTSNRGERRRNTQSALSSRWAARAGLAKLAHTHGPDGGHCHRARRAHSGSASGQERTPARVWPSHHSRPAKHERRRGGHHDGR